VIDLRDNRAYLRRQALRLGAVPAFDLASDPDRHLYNRVVGLWGLIGGYWVMSPNSPLLHAPGYEATPTRVAPLCTHPAHGGKGGGPYGAPLLSRLTPRCERCRRLLGLPPVEKVEPRWRDTDLHERSLDDEVEARLWRARIVAFRRSRIVESMSDRLSSEEVQSRLERVREIAYRDMYTARVARGVRRPAPFVSIG